MRGFLIVWVAAFCLVAVVAAAVSWYVGPPATQPAPAAGNRQVSRLDAESAAPFTETDAVEVVARRFPTGDGGDQLRRELQGSATVTYHSAQHWRVCYDSACWVAHGPGRYAEPDNDAARQRETRAAHPR